LLPIPHAFQATDFAVGNQVIDLVAGSQVASYSLGAPLVNLNKVVSTEAEARRQASPKDFKQVSNPKGFTKEHSMVVHLAERSNFTNKPTGPLIADLSLRPVTVLNPV
jgi:hypothetical protein